MCFREERWQNCALCCVKLWSLHTKVLIFLEFPDLWLVLQTILKTLDFDIRFTLWSPASRSGCRTLGATRCSPAAGGSARIPDQCSESWHWHCCQIHWSWCCYSGSGRIRRRNWNSVRKPYYRLRQVKKRQKKVLHLWNMTINSIAILYCNHF